MNATIDRVDRTIKDVMTTTESKYQLKAKEAREIAYTSAWDTVSRQIYDCAHEGRLSVLVDSRLLSNDVIDRLIADGYHVDDGQCAWKISWNKNE